MPFTQHNGLRYFQFNALQARHAIFTRHGGISPEPWNSLNVGGTVGDEIERVRQNRLLSFEALECKPDSIFDVWQVHSADAVCARAPRRFDEPYRKADIILTDRPEVTLFMRFADCVPLLFHDPRKGIIGVAHAGWMGTVKDVATRTVNVLQAEYGSDPADVIACIGPSIGPDHYEVGEDVIRQVRQTFGKDSDMLLEPHDGRIHFNLWKANQRQLERAGIGRIELAGICTACHTDDWYSHRAEKGRTGRFGALIALQ
ncbi:MAG: peptidoglycan editing factor PgeF [Anaerolineales bacterium]|nr:peptidoglycan editing factor PgeF [Anaerolineae bacterium]PWB77860.1 MAG: peptidoglycan editing factor PgeF [Anaerolineales bacterium]